MRMEEWLDFYLLFFATPESAWRFIGDCEAQAPPSQDFGARPTFHFPGVAIGSRRLRSSHAVIPVACRSTLSAAAPTDS